MPPRYLLRLPVLVGMGLSLWSCGLSGGALSSWTHKAWHIDQAVSFVPPAPAKRRVPLGIIEFDDQGQMWERDRKNGTIRQKEQLGEVLREIENQSRAHSLVLVLFVHGWNNNGDPEGDGNLKKFQESVVALDNTLAGTNSKVFGVFISWRGMVQNFPTGIDFYNREASALKIGRVEATGAVHSICSMVKKKQGNRVIAVGHSLGGVILLRSIAQPLAAQIAELSTGGGGTVEKTKPIADTIVLLNPADNAILARQLVKTMKDFKVSYRKRHNGGEAVDVPMVVSITSKADWATGWVYSGATGIARYLIGSFMTSAAGGVSSTEQEWATVTSVGHHKNIHSHCLVEARGLPPADSERLAPGDKKSPSAFIEQMVLANTKPRVSGRRTLTVWLDPSRGGSGELAPYEISPIPGASNQTPYWILQVPKWVSSGHTDIWNPNFIGLLSAIHFSSAEDRTMARQHKKQAAPAAPMLQEPQGFIRAAIPE